MQTATQTTSKATVKKSTSKKTVAAFSAPIAEVHLVPIELIDVLEQIRTEFDQESIEELARDIELRGLMQPVLLNPNGGRFTMIAGERRLRAIQFNGQAAIPALLTKASAEEAMLMQLAENVQREELSFTDECTAICKLYEALGSLKEVAAKVKKSVPWCSKRYAITQDKIHFYAKGLLEDGTTEDIELLKAFSSLIDYSDWHAAKEWQKKIRTGEAGRNEIRAALKAAKENHKKHEQEQAAKAGEVSHAKVRTPPPPPPWTIQDAIEDLEQALLDPDTEQTATDLAMSYTLEQQSMLSARLCDAAQQGREIDGFKKIGKLIMKGQYNTGYNDLDLMAMIAGTKGIAFDWLGMLAALQTPKETT